MTYQEAINNGYTHGDATLARGYVSRKADLNALPVMIAGGKRKGQLYVELPNRLSSQYKIRQYLIK